MLTEVKSEIQILLLTVRYNIMREMTNKAAFITNVLFMMLNNSTFIIQWAVLFHLKKEIGGYGMKEIILLWALAASSYGFAHIFFHKAFSLSDLITEGKLDAFLVQPKKCVIISNILVHQPSGYGRFTVWICIDIFYGNHAFKIPVVYFVYHNRRAFVFSLCCNNRKYFFLDYKRRSHCDESYEYYGELLHLS